MNRPTARRASAPWHPAFVHFPLACWVLATLFDIATLAGVATLAADWNLPDPTALSSLLLWLGLALSVPAIAFGFMDYASLPIAARDSVEMSRHVGWMGAAASLFLISALLRLAAPELPRAYYTGIELLGTLGLVVGGHCAAVVVFERLPETAAGLRPSGRVPALPSSDGMPST